MFGLKKKIIDSAIDSFFEALEAKLKELKEKIGDNDHNGQNDVDQVIEMVRGYPPRLKEITDKVNIGQISKGVGQISAGLAVVSSAIDKEALQSLTAKAIEDMKLLGSLVKVAFERLKEDK